MPSFLMNVSTLLYIHPHVDEWIKKATLLRNDNCQTYSDLFVIIEPLFLRGSIIDLIFHLILYMVYPERGHNLHNG